jgi:hypothetical protein
VHNAAHSNVRERLHGLMPKEPIHDICLHFRFTLLSEYLHQWVSLFVVDCPWPHMCRRRDLLQFHGLGRNFVRNVLMSMSNHCHV